MPEERVLQRPITEAPFRVELHGAFDRGVLRCALGDGSRRGSFGLIETDEVALGEHQCSNVETVKIQFVRMCISYFEADMGARMSDVFISEQDRFIFAQQLKKLSKKPVDTANTRERMFQYDKAKEPVEDVIDFTRAIEHLDMFEA